MLDFRMESFLAVCRHMNYTRAAEELNLTQPAVSQHIRWLEEYYAAPLFHYTNKRLSLTPAGQLLLTAATTVQHDQAQLKRQMQQTLQHPQDLRFGVTPTVGMYLLPGPLAKYHRTYPQANLFLQVNNTQSLCDSWTGESWILPLWKGMCASGIMTPCSIAANLIWRCAQRTIRWRVSPNALPTCWATL